MRKVLRFGDIALYLGVYAYCAWAHRPGWQYIAGMALATAGYALWFTARAQLGAAFSLKPEARKLVTCGLYSKFRHPIYLFSTVGLLGLCIAMRWYVFGSVYVVAIAIMQWRRAKAERAVLEAAFGDRYREYRKRTWF
jgi:protein-S-isoprenylcysteine O-methyltransferase Ste14